MNEAFEDLKKLAKQMLKKTPIKVDDKKLAKEFVKQVKALNRNIETLTDGMEFMSEQMVGLNDKIDRLLDD